MFNIVVFVPMSHLAQVKSEMFAAGAGKLGNYDQCCFETLGTGQFRPLENSQAFIGEVGRLEQVEEVRVEMLCQSNCIESVIKALKSSHPYETPAYYVSKLLNY